MSIAEKLTTIAENEVKVYEAGKAQGGGDEFSSFKNMDSINYFFMSNFNSYYLDKLDKLDLSNIKRAQYVFRDNTTAKRVVMPYMPKLEAPQYMFQRCTSLEYVEVDTSNLYVVSGLFQGCTSLKKIGKPLDFSKAEYTSLAFNDCIALEKVEFTGSIKKGFDIHWSTKLTAESLESIVTHLSTTVTGQTITLPTTAESTYNAKYGEGAWATLIAPVTNWTFAYA